MTESQKAFEENYKDFYDLPDTGLLKNSKGDYANNRHYVEFKKWQAAEAYGRKQAAVPRGLLDQPAITKMTIPPPQAEMADVVYAEGWNAACDAYFGGLPPQEPLIVTIENTVHLPALKAQLEHLKQVIIGDRIEWEDFPPDSRLAFAQILKD